MAQKVSPESKGGSSFRDQGLDEEYYETVLQTVTTLAKQVKFKLAFQIVEKILAKLPPTKKRRRHVEKRSLRFDEFFERFSAIILAEVGALVDYG